MKIMEVIHSTIDWSVEFYRLRMKVADGVEAKR